MLLLGACIHIRPEHAHVYTHTEPLHVLIVEIMQMYERLTYLEKMNKQLAEEQEMSGQGSSVELMADNAALKQEIVLLKERCATK
jgi:hypothetical protein